MSYIDKLSKTLHTRDIKKDNIKYYCTKYPEWNQPYKVEPMFDNIEPFQYYQTIEKLDLDDDILEVAKEISGKIVTKSNDMIDQIMLEYIKCRPHCCLIMMRFKKINSDLLDYLNKNGNVYYIKHIELTWDAARSLIYQIYADTDQYNTLEGIDDVLKNTYKFDKNGGYISVVVFDNIYEKNYGLFKLDINRLMIKRNAFYMTTFFYRTIEHAQIYFCHNSIEFLHQQLLERHINVTMRKSRIMLSTFRRWISNISLIDRRNFLIFSGAVLYVYGLRNIHDIDVYIDDNCQSKDTIHQFLLNEDTKFYFIDGTMPNTHTWKTYWNQWSIKWANMLNAEQFDDFIYNPKYHFYYLGLKFLVLDGDIKRRLIRQRPRAFVDLIKLNQLLNCNIQLPKIPRTQIKYIKTNCDDAESLDLKENQKYNIKNKEIETVEEIDLQYFLSTMQWYFKHMYSEEYTLPEIKKMVGIRTIRIKRKN